MTKKSGTFWLTVIAAFYLYNSFIAFIFFLSPYEPGMNRETLLFKYPSLSLLLSILGFLIGYGFIKLKPWAPRLVVFDFILSILYYIADYGFFGVKKLNLNEDGLIILVDLVIYYLILQYIYRPEIKIIFEERENISNKKEE
ncbi:MAG: hypothetical protein D6734_01475 [Candidatus Schekmanbacteria bacterium]|nr:MAG: hypothetical protein D6734_01475 [Candidatus Schekmanbacteria bacterium]